MSSDTSSTPASSGQVSHSQAAGIAVGVVLGVSVVGSAAAAYWWRKRHEKDAQLLPITKDVSRTDSESSGYSTDLPPPPPPPSVPSAAYDAPPVPPAYTHKQHQ